ncbi:MAG: hypothetical protein KGQ46_09475 [Hyphomicrobiales bacterium]|nr:hypothetical protein [Hyphomicrobiales bacterium]MDE2115654.1 hypothetical protein [Hyphomicrobiales bacterium]
MEKLRLMLLGIAALALVALGAQVFRARAPAMAATVPAASMASSAAQPQDARAQVIASFQKLASFRPYYDNLATALPDEYARVVNAVAKQEDKSPATSDDANMALAMRYVRENYGALAGHAQGADLDRILKAQQAILNAMGDSDPGLCVSFFYGGGSPGFADFSAKHRDLIAELAQANLAAIIAGKANKTKIADPSDADVQMLDDALVVAKVSPAAIDLLLDNKSPDPPLSDAQMCRAGQDYLSALLGLSSSVRWRLMSRSLILAARS